MDPIEKLKKEAAALLAEAEELENGGDIKSAEAKLAEAEEKLDEVKRLERKAAIKAGSTPAEGKRPGPLPTQADPEPEPKEDEKVTSIKTIHTIRYGEPDAAINKVLVDLYGPDYAVKRYEQQMAFNRYLRTVRGEPSGADRELLGQVILTPALAKQAIKSGVDVSFLKATIVEAQDELGGWVVPVDFQADIIEKMAGIISVRRLAMVTQTSRDRVEYPTATTVTAGENQRTSAITGKWVEEKPTAGTAATNLTFGMESIPVHTYMAEVPLSRNSLEDAAFNLADYLSDKFAEDVAFSEEEAFLIGDGSGKPEGILPGGANSNSLAVVNSGAAADIDDYDNIIALPYAVASQYRRQASCAWLSASATYKKIALMKSGSGDTYYWDRAERTAGKLEGYPVEEQESMPAVAANSFSILFGDFKGYRIVDRVGMTVERYLDSQTARQNMVMYVLRARRGGQLVEPWRFAVMKTAA